MLLCTHIQAKVVKSYKCMGCMGMGVEISVSTFLRAQLCGANNDNNLLDVTLVCEDD